MRCGRFDGSETQDGMSQGVLLLHGVKLPRLMLTPLAHDLKVAGFGPVLNWSYESWRPGGIAAIAERMAKRLNLEFPEGVPPLDLVGHSMGGLIQRRLLADGIIPSGGRYISLGTPHFGATRADRLGDWLSFRLLFGSAGQDLRPDCAFLKTLPLPPPTQSLCIYGGTGNDRGFMPSLPGDNDGTVEAKSAVFPGAASHRVKALHIRLPVMKESRRMAVKFLCNPGHG